MKDRSCLYHEEVNPQNDGIQWDSGKVTFYDLQTNRPLSHALFPDAWENNVYFSPDLRLVAISGEDTRGPNAGGPDGKVNVYDVQTGECRVTLSDPRGEYVILITLPAPLETISDQPES